MQSFVRIYGPGLLVFLVLVVGGMYAFQNAFPASATHSISVGGVPVEVHIADTNAERNKGLSGTKPLLAQEGMLFVFPEDGRYSFWMKDMTYAIDVLWLSKEGQIVYAIPGLAPESYPKTFTSDTPARYVLELRAGFMDLHNVSVGDFVSL